MLELYVCLLLLYVDVLCALLCMLFKLLISAFFLFMFMGLFARLLWCSSCPLHRFKGWGHASMVSEPRLQQWASMGHEGCSDKGYNYLLCSAEQ